jgi:hypothetical protein
LNHKYKKYQILWSLLWSLNLVVVQVLEKQKTKRKGCKYTNQNHLPPFPMKRDCLRSRSQVCTLQYVTSCLIVSHDWRPPKVMCKPWSRVFTSRATSEWAVNTETLFTSSLKHISCNTFKMSRDLRINVALLSVVGTNTSGNKSPTSYNVLADVTPSLVSMSNTIWK